MRIVRWIGVVLLVGCLTMVATAATAQEKSGADKVPTKAMIEALEKTLTGAKLTGRFTVTGKGDDKMPTEEYTIASARYLGEGDSWLVTARIKYGKTDGSFPVPLEVKWAGDTPVLTLSNIAIPKLGTFSARVVIHDGKYAGTWQHDAVGGHLFGTISRADAAPKEGQDGAKAESKDQPSAEKKN